MANSRLKKLVAAFFFIAVTIYFMSPIMDPDFPWHIKTGEYIYQHREIPKTDPFSIASTGSSTEKFLLSQYWLAQVIFYLIFSTIGPLGIIMLRSLIFTGIIAILWFSMKEAPLLLKACVLYFTATLFLVYLSDRPQLFTFLLAAVVVVILENYRKTTSVKWLALLPAVMLFWANAHGGFILGDVLIIIVCLSEAVKYFFIRKPAQPLTERKLLWLLVIGLASIMVSYVNPNSSYAFIFAFEGATSPYIRAIKEYQTPLMETWGPFANRVNFIYWAVMGYSLVLLALNLRRLDITHLGLVFFTLYISLDAVRFVPFFVMTSLIISGPYRFGIRIPERFRHNDINRMSFPQAPDKLGQAPRVGPVPILSGNPSFTERFRTSLNDKAYRIYDVMYTMVRRLQTPVNILLLITVIFWGGYLAYSHPGKRFLTRMVGSRLYPEQAVLFLEQNVPSAKMFNSHGTGSYLLLRLYPKFKVFIDTRAYNTEMVLEANDITYAKRWDGDQYSLWDALNELLPKDYGKIEINAGARPADLPKEAKWLKLLRQYNIDIIVHEASNFYTGELYPLCLWLIKNEEWKLVYSDGKVMIFVRDIPLFKDLITKYEMKKEQVYDEIGMENAPKLGSLHSRTYSSLAFALLMKGGSDKLAEEYIKHALYLDPKDIFASYLEAFLKIKRAPR